MHKFLIYGVKQEMDLFFQKVQEAGFLEFIGIWHKKALALPEELKRLVHAVKILKRYVGSEGIEIPEKVEHLARLVVEKDGALEELLEKRRLLCTEIARVTPFGEFSKEDLDAFQKDSKRCVQFFCRKSSLAEEIDLPKGLIYIATDYDLDYYMSIQRNFAKYPKMIEIVIRKPVQDLRVEMEVVSSRIEEIESWMKSCSLQVLRLQEELIEDLNAHHVSSAKHDASFPLGQAVFAIEAWVPATQVEVLKKMASTWDIGCEEIAIEPKDFVPTCMENRGAGLIGEDLVQIYDTPATIDKDPSWWVVVFFSIFFAMIIADAGYGLLYLATGLFLKWKISKPQDLTKRMIQLLMILGTTTILWGVVIASFFGIELEPENSLQILSPIHYLVEKKADYIVAMKGDFYHELIRRHPSVANVENGRDFLLKATVIHESSVEYPIFHTFYDNILMEFALLIGILHISSSFLRSIKTHFSGAGWILCLLGGYFLIPVSVLDATSITQFMGWLSDPVAYLLGMYLLVGGGIIVLCASAVQHGIQSALGEIFHVVQIFGDVLSYLRLYALGLAGMIVASTFNSLGSSMGWIGIFVIVAGHLLNLCLSVMSGVIHGLRLNFLEWYRYSFHGGGRNFNPLKLMKPK